MNEATYCRPQIPEHCGNPLIEALPPISTADQILDALSNYPPTRSAERSHAAHLRLHYLDRILDVVQAQPEHIAIAMRLSRLIRHGYKSRNPLLAAHLRQGYMLATEGLSKSQPPAQFAKCRTGAYITGLSGIGKSTIIERALASYPQVVSHRRYRDVTFAQTQIVWLKLDCPHDGSAKQLCLNFFAAVDEALEGADYFDQYSRRRSSIEQLISAMAMLIHSYHVGILVIDEIQNLTCSPRGGETKMLNLLVSLMNRLGLPQLLIGTFESAPLFSKTFRNARRVSFGGPIVLDRYKSTDTQWMLFVETLWHYQWTSRPVPLTAEFAKCLYDASQGVTDLAVAIYMLAQEQAITSGAEVFTCEDVNRIVPEKLTIIQAALEALCRSDRKAYEQFRELLPPIQHWRQSLSVLDGGDDIHTLVKRLERQRDDTMRKRSEADAAASAAWDPIHDVSSTRISSQQEGCTDCDAPAEVDATAVADSQTSSAKLPDLERRVLRGGRARS